MDRYSICWQEFLKGRFPRPVDSVPTTGMPGVPRQLPYKSLFDFAIPFLMIFHTFEFLRTLLCCESENFTWNGMDETGGSHVLHEAKSLLRIIYRIMIPTIVASGIFGNILILAVLSSPIFRGISYLYLRGVAFAHVGVLLSWIPICT